MPPLERWTKRVNLLWKVGETEAKYESPKELITIFLEMVSPLGNLFNNLKDVGEKRWVKKDIFSEKEKR